MRKLLAGLCALALGVFACIVLIVVFVDHNVTYIFSDNNIRLLPNLVIVLFDLLVVWLIARARFGKAPRSYTGNQRTYARWYDVCSVVVPVAVLLVQVIVYIRAGLITGWDVSILEDTATFELNALQEDGFYSHYFNTYPNNLFLLFVLRSLERLRQLLSPSTSTMDFFAYASCAWVSISCLAFMRVAVRFLKSERGAMMASVLYVALLGLSPWYMIPYSDSLGLFFCMLILWVAVCESHYFARVCLASLIVMVGIAIKPTLVFVYASMLIVSLMLLNAEAIRWRSTVLACAIAVLGLGMGWGLVHVASATIDLRDEESAQFTMTHYLMMGLNDDVDGAYSEEDVTFSSTFDSVEERQNANLQMARRRIREFGPLGLARHLLKKLLVAYNDGTFAWGVEGGFIREKKAPESGAFGLIGSYYYPDGSRYQLFCTVQQTLWLLVLLSMPLGLLGVHGLSDPERTRELLFVSSMLASVMALTVFVLVFEVRARYLYLYGGCYVLLASWGLTRLRDRVGARTSSVKRGKPKHMAKHMAHTPTHVR